MSILDIENAKKLKVEGARLGRDGLSQRVHVLVADYMIKNPEGHYMDAIKLAGALHAIFLATGPRDYWREVAERGFNREMYDLKRFEKKPEWEFFLKNKVKKEAENA